MTKMQSYRVTAALAALTLLAGCRALNEVDGGATPASGPLGGTGSSIAMAAATHDPYVLAYRAAARRLRARYEQLEGSDTATSQPTIPTLCFPAAGCLPAADQTARTAALDQTFFAGAVGTATAWSTPGGDSGTATLSSAFTAEDGAQCRTFAEEITLNGQPHAADGAACLEQDGRWRVIDAEPRPPVAG
jgi:hypothetical protein